MKRRLLALGYMRGMPHLFDAENSEGSVWSTPSCGRPQDMQPARNGRVLVSRDDGWAFHRLDGGGSWLEIDGLSGPASRRLRVFDEKSLGSKRLLDAKEMRDAQENPEENKGLIVRIDGRIEYFNDLEKELQDTAIQRGEHGT
jgi:hypothetical protein